MRAMLRRWARRLKAEVGRLWFIYRHPATPWYVRALVLLTLAYALSPIDLIPDFIPVLGFLDDVLLLPGLIWLALRLTPRGILEEGGQILARHLEEPPAQVGRFGATVILVLWVLALSAGLGWFVTKIQ